MRHPLKRIATATCALIITIATGLLAVKPEAASAQVTATESSGLHRYTPRFNRAKPVVAVIAENSYTELTDYVLPYGVLTESGGAQVFALATKAGPIQMFPALRLEPQATAAEFDARFPEGADYVIVPAVHRVEDPALLTWVNAQAKKGATIVGVCDGVWVLAHAGLLKGRKAVGHWYSFDDLKRKFPDTQWIKNIRYIEDGNVITTTGVTASIPVSLALVEAISGHERANALAHTMGAPDWSAAHQSDRFKLDSGRAFTAARNWLSFWAEEDIGIPIADGVDEMSLALSADAYSRTYRSTAYSLAATSGRITTRHGLVVLPDKLLGSSKVDRVVTIPAAMPPVAVLDATLRAIGQAYGAATADFVALQLEYPTSPTTQP